jgi:hypothetical protein
MVTYLVGGNVDVLGLSRMVPWCYLSDGASPWHLSRKTVMASANKLYLIDSEMFRHRYINTRISELLLTNRDRDIYFQHYSLACTSDM